MEENNNNIYLWKAENSRNLLQFLVFQLLQYGFFFFYSCDIERNRQRLRKLSQKRILTTTDPIKHCRLQRIGYNIYTTLGKIKINSIACEFDFFFSYVLIRSRLVEKRIKRINLVRRNVLDIALLVISTQ